MAAPRTSRRTYRQIGVFLPLERYFPGHHRIMNESTVPPLDGAMEAGFLYVKDVSMGTVNKLNYRGERVPADKSIFIVQSASTGELFMNKILERPWDPDTRISQAPLELRASTYPKRIGDATIDIGGNVGNGAERDGVLPDVPYFNKLRFWQELDPVEDHDVTVFSLFFEFCNGGTLDGLMNKYFAQLIAIPEHFIWLVAEQLFLAIVLLRFGRYPRQDDYDDRSQDGSESDQGSVVQPHNWARIYHRDLFANNIFINYIPKGPGRVPRVGLANNAFPEIVVGDFGNSAIEGDDPATLHIPDCVYQPSDANDDEPMPFFEWEDIFAVGESLRSMTMTHSGIWNHISAPNNERVQTVNQWPTAPPYSDELITMLQRFEFRDMEDILVRDLGDELDTAFPSPEEVRDTLLPQAQARVAGYLNPAGKPDGYFDGIDVSWTRPEELMPFSYIMQYATDAGEGPDGRPPPPPPNDGSDGDSGGDEDAGDEDAEGEDAEGEDAEGEDAEGEDAEGEDAEMSDSPVPPEEGHDDNGQPDDGPEQPGDHEQPGGADDENNPSSSSAPTPPPLPPAQVAMRELGKMHKWNNSKPRYELRSLEFGPPAILPLKRPP